MTDPVETRAPERIWAWSWGPWVLSDGQKQGGYCRPENRHALDVREKATGAEYIRADLVDALVAKERAACADLAQLTAQGFHEAASLPDVTGAEITLRKTAAKAALLVEIQIRMRGGEAHQIDMGAAQ